MPSTASKPPSGAASTRVTRTPSRCGTGPVAASATPAGAAGGPTTTTSSPPPSSDRAPRASVDDHAAGDFAGFHRADLHHVVETPGPDDRTRPAGPGHCEPLPNPRR